GVLHSGPSHDLLRPASQNSYLAGPSARVRGWTRPSVSAACPASSLFALNAHPDPAAWLGAGSYPWAGEESAWLLLPAARTGDNFP
ncbi:MAG: hypothetical protein J6X69_05505, partial [Bacteroidales bacterium]|nr:hypothetical protein [Bacteroidales bacterium]